MESVRDKSTSSELNAEDAWLSYHKEIIGRGFYGILGIAFFAVLSVLLRLFISCGC